MCAGAATFLLAGCQSEDLYNPDAIIEKYNSAWEETFGTVDANQTWNMATQVTANIELDDALDAATVYVYTSVPGGSNCQLLAEYPATTRTFTFDILSGAEDAYVVVTNSDNQIVLNGYYDITSGAMTVANAAATRAVTACPTTLAGFYSDLGAFQDANGTPTGYANTYKMYNLNNVTTENAASWKLSDFVDIVGTGGVFAEAGKDENGACNIIKWSEALNASTGATYVLSDSGTVSLSYIYGATGNVNIFGYLYYKSGASNDEILKANRYILMDNASPLENITYDDGQKLEQYQSSGGSIHLSTLVSNYQNNNGDDHKVTGTKYNLVYFGEDGQATPTYTFPAGTEIAFFIITNGYGQASNQLGGKTRYSLPWMNETFGFKYADLEKHSTTDNEGGERRFVSFKWNGQLLMGVEDSSGSSCDCDMNDIVFTVQGNFEDNDTDIGKEADPATWILACEDLGSTADFDFNDVVFSVSHTSGKDVATITPLAAGGIYPASIENSSADVSFNGKATEIHGMLGSETTDAMINTTKITNEGTPIMITVPTDFSMSTNSTNGMGGFYVSVTREDGSQTSISSPGQGNIPQMICVPSNWLWPLEKTSISTAYPYFGEWGANYGKTTWYTTYESDCVVAR